MATTTDTTTASQPGGEDSSPKHGSSIDWTVFGVAFGLILTICVLGVVFTDGVAAVSEAMLGWVTAKLGWLFLLAATGFVLFALVLAFSRYGRIPLSRNGEPPEFSTVSWAAMMFSAGMGIGLMFYGVYEPVTHLATTPPPVAAEVASAPQGAQGDLGAQWAMAYTLFHWCLHPWAIYAVVGLALAYSTFRMGRGNLISSPFQALFGKKRIEDDGWGKPIDIFAITTTKFGSAVSMGLGALQIAAGINLLRTGAYSEDIGAALPIIVICVLSVFVVLSAVSGVSRGIKWLSNTNMVVAGLLLLFVFVVGPTVFILDLIPSSIGMYFSNLIPMSFTSAAFGGNATQEWLSAWTIFYWAWWISWTPFVGTFIARISRGRTIREFITGVLIVPTVVTILWFSIFGGAGINLQLSGIDIASRGGEAAGFFAALQEFPFFTVTAIVVMFLTAIFFVSGADAGALVLSTLSSRGSTEPKTWLVVLWALMTGVVASVLLLVDGLTALKTFTILASSPFIVIMIGLCISLYVDLRRDPLRQRRPGPVRGHAPSPGAEAPFQIPVRAGGNGSAGRQDQEEEQPAPVPLGASSSGSHQR